MFCTSARFKCAFAPDLNSGVVGVRLPRLGLKKSRRCSEKRDANAVIFGSLWYVNDGGRRPENAWPASPRERGCNQEHVPAPRNRNYWSIVVGRGETPARSVKLTDNRASMLPGVREP